MPHHAASHSTTAVEAPPAPPCPIERVAPMLRTELCAEVDERGQVTVHCALPIGPFDCIRIWPSTYLVCRHTGHRSPLLHAEGIPFAPIWLQVPPGRAVCFTLLFAGLPKHCVLFDLVEEIEDPGGFHVPGILRNEMDVYRVDIQ
ncbi:MAG: hypothetical protein ABI432_06915 [Flavobacteriales bacterium]